MVAPATYCIGVEIELIGEPRKTQSFLVRLFYRKKRTAYYKKLARYLNYNGAEAIADNLKEGYRKHTEHYDKWWITKDGSLKNPDYPLIPLEAVSPIFNTNQYWEAKIDTFWDAWGQVFRAPEVSRLCGSHVHVSPSPAKYFDFSDLRLIAFGVVFYEPLVKALLPLHRQDNKYCRVNTLRSSQLGELADESDGEPNPRMVWRRLEGIYSRGDLRQFMQGGARPREDRYVLWNFDNIMWERSGTIEFRGGPGLGETEKTKRWISFVAAFVRLCLGHSMHYYKRRNYRKPTMDQFWEDLLRAAKSINVKGNLPSEWEVMAETSVAEIYDDSDNSSIIFKSDDEWDSMFDDTLDTDSD